MLAQQMASLSHDFEKQYIRLVTLIIIYLTPYVFIHYKV